MEATNKTDEEFALAIMILASKIRQRDAKAEFEFTQSVSVRSDDYYDRELIWKYTETFGEFIT